VRASRLLSLLLLLQTRGRMTARQLADELEVSIRTVYRDVESLHAAGVPLYGDSGHRGGYQLLDGYRTRLTGLTAREAESLFLAGLPGPAAELGLGAVVDALQLKLHAALPAEQRERAMLVQERFLLDAPGWYADGDASPYLAEVAQAVWSQRRIKVHYRRWKAPDEVVRELEPYGIVLKGGRWYVVAQGASRIATFRVNQILELETLDQQFQRPTGFDLGEYWKAHLVGFRERLIQGAATVRLTAAGAQRLGVEGAPEGDGWLRAQVPIESHDHAYQQFLALGGDVEVLEPVALRNRLAGTAAAMASVYGAG
jgi:predicted DNA-binding transcriptional regulator YafY